MRDDLEGYERRLVRVALSELTCLGCGEIAIDGYCPRCGLDEEGQRRMERPPLVETISYLRDGEYFIA